MMTLRHRCLRRVLGFALAAWMAAGPVVAAGEEALTPAPGGLGTIRGVLYRADEITRLAGATVTAINVTTGRRYVSNYTGDNGAYAIEALPAGTYDLAIDSNGRVYVTDNLIEVTEDQRLYLSFAVVPPAAGSQDTPTFQGGARLTFTDPSAIPAAAAAGEKKSFWKRPAGIALIGILVAGVAAAGVSAQQND